MAAEDQDVEEHGEGVDGGDEGDFADGLTGFFREVGERAVDPLEEADDQRRGLLDSGLIGLLCGGGFDLGFVDEGGGLGGGGIDAQHGGEVGLLVGFHFGGEIGGGAGLGGGGVEGDVLAGLEAGLFDKVLGALGDGFFDGCSGRVGWGGLGTVELVEKLVERRLGFGGRGGLGGKIDVGGVEGIGAGEDIGLGEEPIDFFSGKLGEEVVGVVGAGGCVVERIGEVDGLCHGASLAVALRGIARCESFRFHRLSSGPG